MTVGGLQVAPCLYNFVNEQALPHTGLQQAQFWASFEKIINEFAPRNKQLLDKRLSLQQQIDDWHKSNDYDFVPYKSFLESIG